MTDAAAFVNKLTESRRLLIDARSEKEFLHAHIPGAINIPLLNNEHRHLIGIEYKQKGREAAVILGFKLAGPLFHSYIEKAKSLTNEREILIYCWRGGMRSGIMAWLMEMAGFRVSLLKGGYKAFRNFVLSQFSVNRKIVIVGGNTGSGKTEALKELASLGEQVIDLEALAHHRGSAFGSLGLPPQPSTEQFENYLGLQWYCTDPDRIVWVEGESRSIGRIKIPDELFDQLQSAPLLEIICTRYERMRRILNDYGDFPKEDLATCTKRLQKKLGHLRMTLALEALKEGRMKDWINILLDYYDLNYQYSLSLRNSSVRQEVFKQEKENNAVLAQRLIQAAKNLNTTIDA